MLKSLSCLLAAVTLLGCSSMPARDIEDANGLNRIRAQAIREAAMTYGAQYGLSVRTVVIDAMLREQSTPLDQIFNFNLMLLPHHVVPPVLTESRQSFHQTGPDVLRLSDRIYQIVTPAHFVTTPPSWKDYLLLEYPKPSEPDTTLLPRNEEEQALWDASIQAGWDSGTRQADQIFFENLGKLKRDFIGMSVYHVLLSKHMVTPPFVSKAQLGITGNDLQLRINDAVLRITETANLVVDSQKWQAAVSTPSK